MEILHSILYFLTAISFGCFVIAGNLFQSEYIKNHPVKYICSDVEVTDREGIITSPNYPSLYSSHLSCSWHILGNVGDIITIWFDDIDIEESCTTLISSPCCVFNWLKIGLLANDTEKKVCGRTFKYEPIVSSSHKIWIKFHISKFTLGGRGFQLHYKITPRSQSECKQYEIRCDTNRCISESLKCNGFPDCEDGADEYHCSFPGFPVDCKTGELMCSNGQCIPAGRRCNGIPDCSDGSDEHHCSTPAFFVDCKADEFKCDNGQCISIENRCNRIPDCEDGSDERHCSNKCSSGHSCRSVFHCYNETQHCDGKRDCLDYSDEMGCGFCEENLIRCGSNTTQCYNPLTQKCDKIFHCLNGEDEKDCDNSCPGKIMCDSRRGCYPIKHRCNGVAQCEDASDEKNCVPELCNYEHGGFLCDNRRCIQQVWTCDRTDDCGDGSDERNCLRNSVLTAAVMGSLICALLLVIAISCTCRLHSLRMLEHRLSSRETPLSRLSQEFFFREPPPSYAVAVQGSQHHNLYVENLHYGVPVHRGRRRSRRPRHSRNSMPVPHLSTVPRNCVLVNPDGTVPSPEPVDINSTGESSSSVSSPDSSSAATPGTKDDCVIPISGKNQSICNDTIGDKETSVIQNDNCPVHRLTSNSESLSLEPINASLEDTPDTVQNSSSDHYYCDSDSEPLVP